jgi:hypothetical protein
MVNLIPGVARLLTKVPSFTAIRAGMHIGSSVMIVALFQIVAVVSVVQMMSITAKIASVSVIFSVAIVTALLFVASIMVGMATRSVSVVMAMLIRGKFSPGQVVQLHLIESVLLVVMVSR